MLPKEFGIAPNYYLTIIIAAIIIEDENQGEEEVGQFEVGVLDWFARLWELEKDEYWGYITNCGIEGNLHGILVGAPKVSFKKPIGSDEFSVEKSGRQWDFDWFDMAKVHLEPTLPRSVIVPEYELTKDWEPGSMEFLFTYIGLIANVSDKCYKCDNEAALPNSNVDETVKNPKVSESAQGDVILLERWVEGAWGSFDSFPMGYLVYEGIKDGVETLHGQLEEKSDRSWLYDVLDAIVDNSPTFIKRRETREYVESEEEVELEGVRTRQKKVPPVGKSTVVLEGVSTRQKKVAAVGKSTSNKGVSVTQTRKRRATEEGSSKSVKEGNHTKAPLKKKACLATSGREDNVVLLQPTTDEDVDMSIGQNDVGLVDLGTSSDEGDDTSFSEDKVVGFESGTATEPELGAMSYDEDNVMEVEPGKAIDTDEVNSEESEYVCEIESEVEKKKAAPQASAQTTSAKKTCLATGGREVIATSGKEVIEGDQDPLKKEPISRRRKLHVTRVGTQLRRSTRLIGSDDVVLLKPVTDEYVDMYVGQANASLVQDNMVGYEHGTGTEPSLAAMLYVEDIADEVDSEESEYICEIEFEGEKKKAAPQSSAQTASAKKACLALAGERS
ncbi:hypothetical protein IFM89_032838 [Coptis chinensis]|uniref:Uncharacterized protein n=1 Tax=Coptis chinensis TaxID=261450 RepID=A0A835IFJ7_9MAGN|nr:hypothetical protein IFM89_032838 [Coptis chinensis]